MQINMAAADHHRPGFLHVFVSAQERSLSTQASIQLVICCYSQLRPAKAAELLRLERHHPRKPTRECIWGCVNIGLCLVEHRSSGPKTTSCLFQVDSRFPPIHWPGPNGIDHGPFVIAI